MTFTLLAKIIGILVILSIILLGLYLRYEDELDNLIKYFKEKSIYKKIHDKHGGINK